MRALLSLCLVAAVLPAHAQETFTLRRVATAGESSKYTLKVETTFQGMAVKFTATLLEKVLSVDADGSIVTESTESDVKLELDGNTMDAEGADDHSKTTTDARGRVVLIEDDMVDEASYRVAALNSIIWPENPVSVGSKWSFDREASAKQGTPASVSEFEIVGTEDVKGVSAVKVRYSTKELSGEEPAASQGFHWVDKATGRVLRSEMEWKNAPVSGQIIDAKVVIELAS